MLTAGGSPKKPALSTAEGSKSLTPKQILNLRILDPACGSGSFLLGAYTCLLNYHRDWYVENNPKKHTKKIYQGKGGQWYLTIAEKKQILLNNIFGVDIDSQAVEVTKLSLLLKVLEGETSETIGQTYKIFHERALPDLGNNIKCGNSLIGPDFYEDKEPESVTDELRQKINPFDWHAEFPKIFSGKNPGFDAVIGNPPYVRIQTMKDTQPEAIPYFGEHYKSASKGNYDIYVVFAERGLSLLKNFGLLGFIIPHKFFNAKYGQPFRKVLSDGKHILHIVHMGHQQVFSQVSTYTCLLFLSKSPSDRFRMVNVTDLDEWRLTSSRTEGVVESSRVTDAEWNFVIGKGARIVEKLNEISVKLGDKSRIFQGLVTGADDIFILENPGDIEPSLLRPFMRSQHLRRYGYARPEFWMLFPYYLERGKANLIPEKDFESKYPKAWQYLNEHKSRLVGRERGKWYHDRWYAFGRSQNLTMMEGPKLIIQVLSITPRMIYDDRSLYMTGGGGGPFYGIKTKDKSISLYFLLGIMNSKLFGFLISNQSTTMRGGYIRFSKQYIESAPIPMRDLSNIADKVRHDKMVKLVDRMLDLNKRLTKAKVPAEKTRIQRQITTTDKQIDKLVYKLYNLTPEEIAIVGGRK
jgi:hypothetical protein